MQVWIYIYEWAISIRNILHTAFNLINGEELTFIPLNSHPPNFDITCHVWMTKSRFLTLFFPYFSYEYSYFDIENFSLNKGFLFVQEKGILKFGSLDEIGTRLLSPLLLLIILVFYFIP